MFTNEAQALSALLSSAVGAYALAWIFALVQPRFARVAIALGVVLHLTWLVWRGVEIGFFPLTNKAESFSAAALAFAVVPLVAWGPLRSYLLPSLTFAVAAGIASASFPQELTPPPPLMRTIWYPLHVPLSFLSMGAWVASAGAGLAWLVSHEPVWLKRCDHLALQGLGLWSAGMICGGVWGVLAWGAYFMWDPKIIWSVILWFHYAAFVHVKLTPSLVGRPWLRPALALLGVLWVLVAYVGTSFFFGKSSHAF